MCVGQTHSMSNSSGTGTPRYFNPASGVRSYTVSTAANENNVRAKIDKAGTLARMAFRVPTNAWAASKSITLRINGADATQTQSVAAAATGWYQDTTHSDAVAAGDALAYALTPGTETLKASSLGQWSIEFDATSGNATRLWQTAESTTPVAFSAGVASATRYVPLHCQGDASNGWFTSTETFAKSLTRAPGTLSRLSTYIAANTSTNAATMTTRINGADATQTISVAAGVTGLVEDTTNTDALVSGDEVNYKTVTGAGTANTTCQQIASTFESAATSWDARVASTRTAGSAYGTANANYQAIDGAGVGVQATEAAVELLCPFACYSSNLIAVVVANSGTNVTQDLRSRINGADGNQVVTLAGATGTLEDVTHYDTYAAGDLMAMCWDQMTNASFGQRLQGMTFDTNLPAVGNTGRARRVAAMVN
jgi:hypothetical protein